MGEGKGLLMEGEAESFTGDSLISLGRNYGMGSLQL